MVLKPKIRFKAEDIWDAPENDKRYEVIDGELFVTPAPGWGHQSSLGELYWRIARHVREGQIGKVVPAPVGVVLDDENGVQPDLVYISRDRLHIISERGVEGAPDLIVEVLSPSTESKDRGIKMRRYAAAGVPHYWMLDYRRHFLEAYRLGEQGYELVGRSGPGDRFLPEIFPRLEIAIDDLWA